MCGNIYKVAEGNDMVEEGEYDGGEQGLGVVTDEPPCRFCGERGGHTGQCPVIS